LLFQSMMKVGALRVFERTLSGPIEYLAITSLGLDEHHSFWDRPLSGNDPFSR